MSVAMIQTKKEELLEWCKQRGVFSYVEINDYKLKNFYLRADRTIRDLVVENKIRRIPDDEAVLRGLRKPGRACLAWFEIIK